MLDEPSTRMSPRPNPPMSRSSAHSGKPAGLLTAAGSPPAYCAMP